MNKSKIERLADVALGEAVAALLGSRDYVSAGDIVRQLRDMAEGEQHPDRLEAIAMVLGEVQSEFTQSRERREADVLSSVERNHSGNSRKQ